MSTRSKGDGRERQCRNLLERAGWQAHKKVNNTYDSSDIFGLFDVVAVREGEKPLFIQVKSNRTAGALKALSEAPFVDEDYMNIQVWVAMDYDGWRIKKLEKDGWVTVVDEREHNCNYGEKTVKLYSRS